MILNQGIYNAPGLIQSRERCTAIISNGDCGIDSTKCKAAICKDNE